MDGPADCAAGRPQKGAAIWQRQDERSTVWRSTALYETILKLKDLDECCRFFEDLCTPTELQAMEQRFDVAVYLQQGLVYLDILEKTGASSATISRVRRSMLENGAGGVMQDIIIREGLDQPK